MLLLVWILSATQAASSLLLPHQQLVKKHQKQQKEIQHKNMLFSPSFHHHQTSFPVWPDHQVGHQRENEHQRSFQLPHKVVAFHHKDLHKDQHNVVSFHHQDLHHNQGLSQRWNQKRIFKFNQDEQQRSMQVPESLVSSHRNTSEATENIEAAMVQKVPIR